MSYICVCPKCLARQGAPVGGKLVSQEIGGALDVPEVGGGVAGWDGDRREGAGRDGNARR